MINTIWPIIVVLFIFLKAQDYGRIYLTSFTLGIISDLISGLPLGVSSILLLLFAFTLLETKSKIQVDLRLALVIAVVFELIYLGVYYFLPI